MSTIKVGVLVGSLRKESFNRQLARAIEQLAPADVSFEHIRIDDLPLYNQDFDGAFPAVCQRLKDQIKAVDALLFVTPEYNRSIPGVLKNALDIASRPWGTNSFAGKPGALLGASVGTTGTSMAQQHLRNVLSYLDIALMTQPEVYLQVKEGLFDAKGGVTNVDTKKVLQGFTDRYVAWIKRLKA